MADILNPILDATGETGFPTPQEWFKQRTLGCYNGFHETTIGKVVEFGSILALTSLDDQYKENRKDWLLLGGLKALLVKGAMNSEIGLISATRRLAEKLATRFGPPLLVLANAADASVLTLCAGAGLKPPLPVH